MTTFLAVLAMVAMFVMAIWILVKVFKPTSTTTPNNRNTIKFNFYPSLFNRFSFSIFTFCILLIGMGLFYLLNKNNPLIGGVLLTLGIVTFGMSLKQPDTKEGRKVWLLTFLGQKTDVVVDKLTLVLDWLPGPIIGYVEFKIVKVNKDFPFKKPIRCLDGFAEGLISTSIVPDENDDELDSIEWKSGGQKLADFDNAGGTANLKNIEEQLDVMLTAWIQHFAAYKKVRWMEEHGLELGHVILPAIMGKVGLLDITNRLPRAIDDDSTREAFNNIANSDIDDARHLGVDITKFQCLINPSEEVVAKWNKSLEEDAERVGQIKNTNTMNAKIALRERFYREGGIVKGVNGEDIVVPPERPERIPSREKIRQEIVTEDLIDDGQVKIIENKSGINIANTDADSRGRTT